MTGLKRRTPSPGDGAGSHRRQASWARPGEGTLPSTPLICKLKRHCLHFVFFFLISVQVPLPLALRSPPALRLPGGCLEAAGRWRALGLVKLTGTCCLDWVLESPRLGQSKPAAAASFAERLVSVFSLLHDVLFIKNFQNKIHAPRKAVALLVCLPPGERLVRQG